MLEGLEPLARMRACKIALIAETLSMEDRDILWGAIEDQVLWAPQGLSVALAQRGLKISRYHIEKHRAKTCPC
jgi:hypothetical protein